jgi:hypothetical protein
MSRRRSAPHVLLATALVTGAVVSIPAPASAEVMMKVKVIVEHVAALDSIEEPGSADWYAVAFINGQQRETNQEQYIDRDSIDPDWELSADVPLSAGSVPVKLEIWDDDDGFASIRGADDQADITSNDGGQDNDDPGPHRTLDLQVALAPCSLSGESTAACGVAFTTEGNSDDDNARVRLRVEVEEPAQADGLRLRCMHSPVSPAAGDDVTITVQALDGALATDTVVAEDLELWLDQSGPAQTAHGTDDASFTVNDVPAGSFSYGCRIKDEGVPVFTGWRTVGVGVTTGPVPLVYTGPLSSRIDIVFIADRDSYSGSGDPSFLTDVERVIGTAYYDFDVFLSNQDKFNFWLAPGLGDARPFANGACPHTTPPGYEQMFAFADTGALIHTDDFRDCAPGGQRLFSSEPTTTAHLQTVRHESGHRPFGLADEYCCDGGYYEQDEVPNVYESAQACQTDAPSLGYPASFCRSFMSTRNNQTYWVSDPASNDLMVDNTTPQAADLRRINWLFGNCAAAKC